jgi:hypothetical protein
MKGLIIGAACCGILTGMACIGLSSAKPQNPPLTIRCLSRDTGFEEPLRRALRYADVETQQSYRLSPFDSSSVRLVTDPALCTRISWLFGPVPAGADVAGRPRPRYSDVVVIQLGGAGYLAYSHWHVSRAGEFLCDLALVDAEIKKAEWLCG